MKQTQEALMAAINEGQKEAFDALIQSMLPTDLHFRTEDDDTTPLAEAARYGNHNLVQALFAAQWTVEEIQEAMNAATMTMMDGIDPAQFTHTMMLLNQRLPEHHTEPVVTTENATHNTGPAEQHGLLGTTEHPLHYPPGASY
ncbi:MAG: ankyrin repeat domain-containing protein [Rickettsiales bacterium]|nr:ankyrin repeat domain-containing protein [Rickettsiales bacterium]